MAFSISPALVVGAPAFMRGKERFSAPGKVLTSIVRFSAGNAVRTHLSRNLHPTLVNTTKHLLGRLQLCKRPKFPSSAKPGLGPRLVSWTRQMDWCRNAVFAGGGQLPRSVGSLS
jgi:hypothetical protein